MSDARDAHVSVHFAAAPGYATHEVLNQAGALADYNAYTDDKPLVDAMRVFGADWADAILRRAGMHVGSEKVQYLARQANRHLPELRTHDRFGNRIDVVEFHPAYHELMGLIFGTETHSFAWTHQGKQGAHVARAALSYIWNQGENGICCPMGMTFASIPALRHDNQLYDEWAPHILKNTYDDRPLYAKKKAGNTVGMAMTEKQGGSDLRATITTARAATSRRGSGSPYLLTGHKWFFSVPMSDIFLTLAQTEKGLSCFVATGWLPDGSRNRLKIQRLKDKCGNKSNASSEVEFYDLHATMLGDEGHGIRTIIEMAHMTRLDFAIGSSGLMRQALSQAIHHTTNRRAFQRSLVDLPVMRNVMAPLNGIWEGTGNVICLDVLRAMQREPDTVAVFLDEIRKCRGADARLDAFTDEVERRLGKLSEFEPVARRIIEIMAFALQASLLVQYSTPAVIDAFCATRLDGDWGRAFGTMPKGLNTQAIIDRARIVAE